MPPSNYFPPVYVVLNNIANIYTNVIVSVIFPIKENSKQKQPFHDVLQSRLLKNFSVFTGEHLCWSLFLIKLNPFMYIDLSRRAPTLGFFVSIAKVLRTPFFRTPLVAASDYIYLSRYIIKLHLPYILVSLDWIYIFINTENVLT